MKTPNELEKFKFDKLTILNIQTFIAERLPYYESDDKDDFIYLAKNKDIQLLAFDLFQFLNKVIRYKTESKKDIRGVPPDWAFPQWDKEVPRHNWRNYIDDKMKVIWETFGEDLQKLLAQYFEVSASNEKWRGEGERN